MQRLCNRNGLFYCCKNVFLSCLLYWKISEPSSENFVQRLYRWKISRYYSATSCKDCATGTASSTIARTSSCPACSTGKYQNEVAKTSCKDCTAGKYQDTTEATSCKDCATGTASSTVARTSSCPACPAGKYQDNTKQTSCKSCPSGQGTKNTGSTASGDCGTLQNTTQGLPPAPRQQAKALLHVRVVEQGRGLPTNCQKLERTTTETIAEPRATGQSTRVLVIAVGTPVASTAVQEILAVVTNGAHTLPHVVLGRIGIAGTGALGKVVGTIAVGLLGGLVL